VSGDIKSPEKLSFQVITVGNNYLLYLDESELILKVAIENAGIRREVSSIW
jgi:hypothetical protein